MSAYDDEFWNQVRRIAQEVAGRSQFKGTLVSTSYNPDLHAVKGIIQPHGVESGWVPIAALHVGNGFGIAVGPRVGSADALDGQVFDLHFDGGDPDTMVAHHRQFSSADKPPVVQSGEMLLMDQNGTKVFWAQDKSLTILHGPSGASTKFDPSGNITHDGNGQNVTVQTKGNGAVAVNAAGTGGVSVNAGQGGLNLAGQSIALTGPATLNGQPIKTGA